MDSAKRIIVVVALGFWSAAFTLGALRVILPVYFASVGVSVSKIALLFFFFKLSEVFAPIGVGLITNRLGYRWSFIGSLTLHSLISWLYILKPTFAVVYLERFVRGLIGMPLQSAVYVKHFSAKENQRFHINMLLGLRDASKGIGMFVGGVLIAALSFEYSVAFLGFLTGGATLVALLCLPDLKEEVRIRVFGVWGTVEKKMKTLGLARGFLHGAMEAWGTVILPVYLTVVFGLSPAVVGTVMMAEYIFHGLSTALISRVIRPARDSRRALVGCALLLFPICIFLSLGMSVYFFLFLVFLYQFFDGAYGVYSNHLKLEFATDEKTSIDLATYETISNSFKPIGVFVSGLLVDAMGYGWAFYFSSLLVLLSALTCLALPKPAIQSLGVVRPYGKESLALE